MPIRKTPLVTGELYHVFNRTIGDEYAFNDRSNLLRVLNTIEYYSVAQNLKYSFFIKRGVELPSNDNTEKLVEIYSFALMPNHYHFLLKQLIEEGTKVFIANFQNSFAKYYNIKYNRHGGLFQNMFKAKIIETQEQFIHLSRYIHLNPVTAGLIQFEDLGNAESTSFTDYIRAKPRKFVTVERILRDFGSAERYKAFVANNVNYQQKLYKLKYLLLD